MTAKKMERAALKAIKSLRKEKHRRGLPFMINTDELPPHQCYLEYPDGAIKIVESNSNGSDLIVVEELDYFNVQLLKRKLKFK